MQLQFVYGNPKKVSKKRVKKTNRGKKKLASGRKIKNNKQDGEALVAKRSKKKVKANRKAKKHSSKKPAKKRVKKPARKKPAKKRVKKDAPKRKAKRAGKKHPKVTNPEKLRLSGHNKTTGDRIKLKWGMTRPTRGEVAQTMASGKRIVAAATIRKERAHGKKKAVKKRIYRKAKTAIKRGKKFYTLAAKMRRSRRASLSNDDSQRALLKSKGYTPRGTKRVAASFGKRKKTRKNPIFGGSMDYAGIAKRAVTGGMDKYELGALALGGALYPITAAGLAKYAPAVYAKVAALNIPGGAGVGVNFLVGAIAYAVGEKMNNQIARSVGKGLVASAAVGLAAVAGQWAAKQANLIPGATPLAGIPSGLQGADFGSADFGGVDYTMNGVDFTMQGDQMGSADFGGVDFTMSGDGEGMGEGQMGQTQSISQG